ncbi:CHAD domain-containing protein [Patulibacter minatonensis]|uniref:CYTH and CHAD domain-containing protein n=1 Tax=Patulibacter minatonensis TaxID=298163 RepID=UPI0006876334|nr:CHAD domain-containing protein [Patulibacter minatonensis]
MGIEIERKFLVDDDPATWGPAVTETRSWEIRQGYVTPPGADPEVRVRLTRPAAGPTPGAESSEGPAPPTGTAEAPVVRQLTTKAARPGAGEDAVVRTEVEVGITAEEFDELWVVTDGRRIEKLRTEYRLGGAPDAPLCTVDRFGGPLAGLVLAEVEFDGEDASAAFVPPPFLRVEVTADRRYRNAALAGAGRPPAEPRSARAAAGDEARSASAPAPRRDAAPGFQVAAHETLADGLRRSASDQLTGALDALERRIAEEPGKAVHDARKRLKKTRALLRLSRPAIGREVARRENAALRSAAATLSAARDADVLVQTVEALADRYAGRLPAAAFTAVRDALAGSASADRAVPVDDAIAGVRGVLERIPSWPLDATTVTSVLQGEGRAYAAGHAQLPGDGDRPTADELHEWRKRVKDLWYHGLLLQNAWPAVLQPQAEEAHHLSELLGDDHDLAVLRDRLTGAPIDDPAADVDGLLDLVDRRRAELLGDALTLGRRVYAETPKAHTRRLRRCLDEWQGSATPV